MIFLGWNQPLLHSTADWLLHPDHVPETPDLSGTIVVVRGRRAGRRLLELLALKCAERGSILIPPEILTPSGLVRRLTRVLDDEPRTATPLAVALAWAEALSKIDDSRRQRLFRQPGNKIDKPNLKTLIGLGRHLNQLWSEIGGAGLAFRDITRILEERFPHIAEFEVPRWDVLAQLHTKASKILEGHGLIDPTDLLLKRARHGEILPDPRVVLVGVAEMPRIVRDFLNRLPQPPSPLVFAPETERVGFEESGTLVADYWQARCPKIEEGQIHLAERDRDQAFRVTHIVKAWHDSGIASDQITVAVPDTEALPRLREALEAEGFETRWAQGRLASHAPAFQLLQLVAHYLNHAADEPPRYEAVAALARHPDLPGISPGQWSALDRFAITHFPDRFDPASVLETSERVHGLQQALDRFVNLGAEETTPGNIADWTLQFLQRIYGEKEEQSGSPEGRVVVHGLTILHEALAETMQGLLPWPDKIRPADFLSVLLNFLGEQPVPEPSAADAIQFVGWLELVEDDSPAVVVASMFEGAVPESVSSDPFLPGSLRQALQLSDNGMRMARDAYALAAILGSRSKGRAGLALIAPRFDSAENPVRPSRLLLAGLQGEQLARRVWYLAGRRHPEPEQEYRNGSGFPISEIRAPAPIERIPVTSFRDYIESPRKFYFLHVLGLRAEDDDILELEGADVGTLIHLVLAAFGANVELREVADEEMIRRYIFAEFDKVTHERFGPWVQPVVRLQLEEVRRRLSGFARVQAALIKEGWVIRYVEGAIRLEGDLSAKEGLASVRLSGKIDRIDFHPLTGKWRIIDYKTSATGKEPLAEHRKRNGEWRDLQLPLYLKLAAPYAKEKWNVSLTPDNCELTYFLLPEDEGAAKISQPFPAELIPEAWKKAAEIASKILRGEFVENPILRPDRNDPALLALCGQVGIAPTEPNTSSVVVENA